MGRSHAHALRAAAGVFELPLRPVLELLADVDAPTAEKAARALGFARSTGDWKALVADPAVDLVDITAPNSLHKPIALAAIAAGKPVYCEKPLAPNAADAKEMAEAAERAGVFTAVGFNYLKNPMVALARDIVVSGEIGDVVGFRGIHAEDYMTDPNAPFTWRLDPKGGQGVVADLGSHIISIARYVVGPIVSLVGQTRDGDEVAAGRTGVARDARGRGRRPGARPRPFRQRRHRLARGDLGQCRPQDDARLRGDRIERFDRRRPRAAERTASSTSPARPPAARASSASSPVRPIPTTGNSVRRPGHQLGFNDIKTIEVKALRRVARRRQEVHAGLPRGLRNPAGRRRDRQVGAGKPVAGRERRMGNSEACPRSASRTGSPGHFRYSHSLGED